MKVAILGYGEEGRASYRYWLDKGAEVTIVDENTALTDLPEFAMTLIGPKVFKDLEGFDLLVRTPSLSLEDIKTDGKIWSATNEFFAVCPSVVIGVTGTKGKGTTATLISEILRASGKTVHLLGNIGVPALSVLSVINPDDLVVFELSSFQLWDLQKSPQTAVVLMIEPDHLDIHGSMDEYVGAKTNISSHQSTEDLIVFHPTNDFAGQIAKKSPAQKKRYMTAEGAEIIDGNIVIDDQIICSVSKIGLIGLHNLENVCAAITAAWKYTKDIDAIRKAVTEFKGLPHRLEFVRELKGVGYYDDSFSSAPGATVAAIQSFSQPEILICGGFDRGLDYEQLARAIVAQQNLKEVILMGQTKQHLARSLDSLGFTRYQVIETSDLKAIVYSARELAEPGDVIVLSPGCASFDMFKNFKDRGEQFKRIVGELK